MKIATLFAILSAAFTASAFAESPDPLYRELSLRVRSTGSFLIPMASGGNQTFEYQLIIGVPKYSSPQTTDFYRDPKSSFFTRRFFDKVFIQDGSYLLLNGEQVPLTCIHVDGLDNRFSGKDSPLVPDLVLRVYLVANDFSCTGPINPQWPETSPKKETWETYLYFEIRDPTIMLPTEVRLRHRWNEFVAIPIQTGGNP